jgi:mRNA-degrading endonuclease RelE of RelBE toxin-antitoxin system
MSLTDDINVYEVLPTDKFNSDMRFYIKKKRYSHIEDDIDDILNGLEVGEFKGNVLAGIKLKDNKDVYVYKARSKNSDSNKPNSESHGYRLIYYVKSQDKIVYLVTIYYKKDNDRIPSDNEISQLIKRYCE